MDIYIFSDESGVFDYKNNEYFVFAGLIFFGKDCKNNIARKFKSLENEIRKNLKINNDLELKATKLENKYKRRLFNVLKDTEKFCVIIKQDRVLKNIFDNKKSKQRYLDYAYKLGLKFALENLITNKKIDKNSITYMTINCDEHTTATDGKYELRESLLTEYKIGTFNNNYNKFFPPILTNLKDIKVNFLNSKHQTLIRASDIVANRIYNICVKNKFSELKNIKKLHIKFLPQHKIYNYIPKRY